MIVELVGRMLRKTLPFLLFGAAGLLAHGGAFYVDYAKGSDGNSGTVSSPFKTIQKAINAASGPGDTIYLRGGTHSVGSQIELTKGGTASNRFVIRNYDGEKPVVDGSGMRSGQLLRWNYTAAPDYVTLEGITFQNCPDRAVWVKGDYNIVQNCTIAHTGSTGVQTEMGDHNLFRYLAIHDTGWNGISVENSHYTTVEYCTVYDNAKHQGIQSFTSLDSWFGLMQGWTVRYNIIHNNSLGIYACYTANAKIYGNLIYNNINAGIQFDSQTQVGGPTSWDAQSFIYSNTIHGNGGPAIRSNAANYLTIKNNIFSNNNSSGTRELEFGAARGHALDYNLYDPGSNEIMRMGSSSLTLSSARSAGYEAHGRAGTAAFVRATGGDFHLAGSSAARDTGVALAAEFAKDLDGYTRTGSWDIGAYEYQGTTAPSRPSPPRNLRMISAN